MLLVPAVKRRPSGLFEYAQRWVPRERASPLITILVDEVAEEEELPWPPYLESLELWLDKSDIDTLYQDSGKATPVTSDGDPIGAAEDVTSNGRDGTQDTSSKKPTYKTGIQNSLSIGRADGSDDYLAGSLGVLQNWTMFLAFNMVTCVNDDGIFAAHKGSGNDWDNADSFVVWQYNNNVQLTRYVGSTPLNIGSSGVTPGTFCIAALQMNAGTAKIWINGGLPNSASYDDVTQIDCTGYVLSARYLSGAAANAGQNDFGELLLYSEALSEANRTAVLGYLNDKWSVY